VFHDGQGPVQNGGDAGIAGGPRLGFVGDQARLHDDPQIGVGGLDLVVDRGDRRWVKDTSRVLPIRNLPAGPATPRSGRCS
jgi:hypothetical protein